MPSSTEDPDCRFEIVGPSRHAAVCRLIARTFSADEPLAVTVGQSRDEFTAMLDIFLPAALPLGLTMGALRGAHLVGIALTTAYDFVPPPGIEDASPSYPPIGALIAELEQDYERDNAARLGTCAHIHMLAVDADARGAGIARNLVAATVRNARAKGFDAVLSDATHPTSQRVFSRQGFATVGAVRYEDFRHDGAAPFASLATLGAIQLMEKRA